MLDQSHQQAPCVARPLQALGSLLLRVLLLLRLRMPQPRLDIFPRRRTKEWLKRWKGERGGKWPSRDGRIAVATYNIWDDRAAGILSTARALDHANVDVAIVQEVKLKHPKFAPRSGFGCAIHMTAAGIDNYGGVSLLVREDDLFGVEQVKV